MSPAWLAGGTGHAFVIRITPGVCLGDVESSLQYAYDNGEMTRLGKNLGYELGHSAGSTPDQMKEVWRDLRRAIDSGHPCYTYHNFCNQMIGGYDDNGFYFAEDSFPHANQGQGPFSIIGKDRFGFRSVSPGRSKAKDAVTVKDALVFALQHLEVDAQNHGLAAYANWIESIRTREKTGTWRSIRAWHTCRSLGVDFLTEAKERIGGDSRELFDAAREHYEVVSASLGPIAKRSAAAKTDKVEPIDRELTLTQLKAARDAEAKGIEALRKIVSAL